MDQPDTSEILGSSPPPTSEARNPARDDRSFRIRGVPNSWGSEDLKSFLENYQSSADQTVRSLALEVHGRTKTATVTFKNVLPFQILLIDEVWRLWLPIEKQSPRNPYLALEDGFLGITTLYAPPSEDHKVEQVYRPTKDPNYKADYLRCPQLRRVDYQAGPGNIVEV
ncbi:hypothetical protein G7Z17_g9569 [Cylindrodendrum hubeiense]|uniref:Uncharacterized protein n=1 Tax=Cylindrodendrum hubeiense TaxID=595255 RepID=A0A9P5H7L5_9HYPO|nr:hypothetical protein G7Z17_g9569 [Cylindrodendrum hubeiense]